MDFWRPTYSDVAYVDGKFSNEQYLSFFKEVWETYKEKTSATIDDFAAICYHLPYTKMGLKALRTILDEGTEDTQARLQTRFQESIQYSKRVGNIYTASLYLGFLSLLENATLQAGDRIGLFSYGSGAVGEFFTGILQPDYEKHLAKNNHQNLFDLRQKVSIEEYEEIFETVLPTDGSSVDIDTTADPAQIKLSGIKEHMRQYTKN